MTRAESIVGALLPAGETADSPELAQSVEVLPPARDELVSIGLVPYVPDQTVPGGIENIMEGQGEFYHPQVGGQMSANFGDGTDDFFADLLRQQRKIHRPHLAQVFWAIDLVEQGAHLFFSLQDEFSDFSQRISSFVERLQVAESFFH